MRISRSDYPWWVKLGMWGVPGRAGLWAFVALSVTAAIGCVGYGFWDQRCFFGVWFLLSALPSSDSTGRSAIEASSSEPPAVT